MAEVLLVSKAMDVTGLFERESMNRICREHQRGIRDWQYPLWHMLMAESWLTTPKD